jgi:hypothetical protein
MFHKHIEDICNELPRKKVNMVCVVKEYTTTKTNEVKHQKFLIRRNKVLKALHWLKQHHPGYKNVTIVESNERFTDMTYQRTRNNDMYVKVEARNRWIQHLLQQKTKTNLAITPDTKNKLKHWTQTNTYTTLQLEQAILYHSKH